MRIHRDSWNCEILPEVYMCHSSRREFLKSTVRVACSAGFSAGGFTELFAASPASSPAIPPPAEPLLIKKGVVLDMLPAKLSYADRFKLACHVGFEVVQALTTTDEYE